MGFIHPRWLFAGFLNHQQYGQEISTFLSCFIAVELQPNAGILPAVFGSTKIPGCSIFVGNPKANK